MFVVELDRFHAKKAAPLGLVPQTILERTANASSSVMEHPRLLWDYSPGRAFAALRPDGERSARRTLRLAPSYRARTARSSKLKQKN